MSYNEHQKKSRRLQGGEKLTWAEIVKKPVIRDAEKDEDVEYFKGAGHLFPNFHPTPVKVYDTEFRSAEAAYQCTKAWHHNQDGKAEEIKQCDKAIHAMKIGRQIESSSSWKMHKVDVMRDIIDAKAQQCPDFCAALITSGSKELVEDTNHTFWGRGPDGKGHNVLGHILMQKRTNLINESDDDYNKEKHVWPQRRTYTQRGNVTSKYKHKRHQQANSEYQPECLFCGETGHNSRKCWFEDYIQCHRCKGWGHKAKSNKCRFHY